MYLKIDEEKLKEIEELTMTDYDAKLGFVPGENLIGMIDDLLYEIHNLQEKVSDLQHDIDNNYELKRIDLYEEYGVSEKDFI